MDSFYQKGSSMCKTVQLTGISMFILILILIILIIIIIIIIIVIIIILDGHLFLLQRTDHPGCGNQALAEQTK
jgi:uncharacterized SAM-binding protein YcdF (DUF218 family)